MNDLRERLLTAIECCMENDACDRCPMMEDFCDFPFVPFVQLPAPLVEAVTKELKGCNAKVKHLQ